MVSKTIIVLLSKCSSELAVGKGQLMVPRRGFEPLPPSLLPVCDLYTDGDAGLSAS